MKFLLVTETTPSTRMGFVLRKLIEQQGILSEDCGFLSLLGSEPPAGKFQRPTALQIAAALPGCRESIAATDALCLIPMGGTVFRALTGLSWSISNVAGYVVLPEDCRPISIKMPVQVGVYKTYRKAKGIAKGGPRMAIREVPHDAALPQGCRWIVPSIPIESVVKMRYKNVTQFRAALQNARRLVEGGTLDDADFAFSEDVPSSDMDWSGVVAYDLEVPIGSTAIERASLSSTKGTWSFPWSSDAVRAYREATSGDGIRVAHNQQFDIPILAAHGIEVCEPTFDTMLAAALLEPDLPKGLVAVAPLYLLARPWKHLAETVGFTDPFYSAKDAFMERHLGIALQRELEQVGMLDLFTTRLMPSVPVLMDMKRQGIKIDAKAADAWCDGLAKRLHEDSDKWAAMHPTVNPHSPHQLKALLYGDWSLPVQRSKQKNVSTDELALRTLMKFSPEHKDALFLLLQIRETKKLLGTFGQSALGIDRVHPSYLPVGKDAGEGQYGKGLAATGRLACSNPNLQQQPKEARHMYVPDNEGMYFVELDWSQAELRVAAHLSRDEAMLEALKGDIHAVTQSALGCDRTRAKNVVYGSAYGAGPKKLQEVLAQAGLVVSKDECASLQGRLAVLYPAWWSWRTAIAGEASARKYLRNPFGRLRRFLLGSDDVPAALDFLPQSVVADMGWTLYRPIWEEAGRLGGRLTTVVHDSFLVQLPIGTSYATLKALLEREFPEVAPGFYIPADAQVGPNWGEMEKA